MTVPSGTLTPLSCACCACLVDHAALTGGLPDQPTCPESVTANNKAACSMNITPNCSCGHGTELLAPSAATRTTSPMVTPHLASVRWPSRPFHKPATRMCPDLVPKEVAERWLSHLREELPTPCLQKLAAEAEVPAGAEAPAPFQSQVRTAKRDSVRQRRSRSQQARLRRLE